MALAVRWDRATLWNVSPGSPWCAESSKSFDWSAAEGLVLLATLGHGEDSRAEHEAQVHAVCVLWRRKAHFHNPLDHAHIPAEVGGMMRSRMRTQEMRVMGITCCESLAPFLDPGFLNALSPGPIPAGKREGSSPADRATGPDLASILLPWSFPPQEKQTTSFSASLYLRCCLLLIP